MRIIPIYQKRSMPAQVWRAMRIATKHLMRKHVMGIRDSAFLFVLGACVAFGLPEPEYAATITAASCSQNDVANAVSNAARGDTVTVPAGTCTWSTPVSITKGLTLSGAGVGKTVITSSGGSVLIEAQPDATAIANSQNITISGFTFDGANSSSILMQIEGASGISGTIPFRYMIIGDNTFKNTNPSSSTQVGAVIQAYANGNGQLRGVIYHNTFDRCNILLRIFSNNDTRESSNTAFNKISYGTDDNLYFEDNTIMYSSSYTGDNPGWIESGQGGRIAARYNTWNLANATTPQEIWDIHGFQNWNGTVNSGQTGTMLVEYYGNTLTNMGTYRWVDHRGGWGLFFDNVLTGSGGNSIQLYGMSTPGSCPSDITPTPTNYNPVVNNTYFWNNTKNGTNVTASALSSGLPIHCTVAENANWWNYNTSCTGLSCSAGIGEGTTAPTGSCTPGVGYWVASTPTATTSSAVIQNAALYKCSASGTWARYYAPYTYPHPLRTGTTSPGGTSLAPPTNLTSSVQ
jgi:hypothetical protein